MKDFEGNTDELSIDMKNFVEDLENMNENKLVEVPGIKIKGHLDTWAKEMPVTDEDEINTFAVSFQIIYNIIE